MAYFEYKPDKPIYQYCSVDAFRSILNSKSIWLSNIRKSNDPREVVFSTDEIGELFYKVIESKKANAEVIAYSWNRVSAFYNNSNIFCACFTLNRDNLPLWQSYGQGGEGICIGFKPTSLRGIPARVQKITYRKEANLSYIEEQIRYYAMKHHSFSTMQEIDLIKLQSKITAMATSTKHETWQHENEVRVSFIQSSNDVITGIPASETENGNPVWRQKVLTREGKYGPIEYIECPIGKPSQSKIDHAGALSEIIIGHNCKIDADEVIRELTKSGFDIPTISASDCKMR